MYKPHIAVFYQEYIYLNEHYETLIKCKRDQFKQIIITVVRAGKDTGEFRPELTVEITAMAILGMINWTYKWYKQTGNRTIDEIADIYIDLILHAILNKPTLDQEKYQEFFIVNSLLK